MLLQLLLLCGMIGWLLVTCKAFALWQSNTTHFTYQRPRGVGLLWLIQAMHLLLWAYRQTWWLAITIMSLCVRSISTPYSPKFARFAAVPYLIYSLSCCLLE
ncbi:MAG: hypothetical protein DYG89_39745 [Caldilinea sp. CFX5]|nr:hypothetical protein [Caldilinea sp. CFX5]